MQLMIINLPSGEQVASLSHILDADELFIGQSESCQIRLPDRLNNVADQHVRLIREDQQWYVENLSDRQLAINQTEVPPRARQRLLLSDGDILYCGGYQLAASDFSPWQETSTQFMEPPELTAPEEQAPEFCVIPSANDYDDEDTLSDPFIENVEEQAQTDSADSDRVDVAINIAIDDVSMTSGHHALDEMTTSNQSSSGASLIDVLSEVDDLDNDWNIHRGLWYGKISHPQEPDESCFQQPVPDQQEGANPSTVTLIPRIHHAPASSSSPVDSPKFQRSLCQAMLQALDQAIDDFSPNTLAQKFQQTDTASSPVTDTSTVDFQSRMKRCFRWQPETPPPSEFQRNYEHFHQQLMNSKHYRLLFLQRFRQALKEQEPHE